MTTNTSKMEMMTELQEAGVQLRPPDETLEPEDEGLIFEEKNQHLHHRPLQDGRAARVGTTTFLHNHVKGNGKVLFVGCKKQAQEAVEGSGAGKRPVLRETALARRAPSRTSPAIRKSVKRLREIEETRTRRTTAATARRNSPRSVASRAHAQEPRRRGRYGEAPRRARHHRHESRADRCRRGQPVWALPIVAIVDTNCDPERVDYPIAGNDDAIRSIRVILQKLVDAIMSARGVTAKQDTDLAAVAE